MYYLTAEESFDAAHFLYGYKGKCSNLHGHRWRVILKIQSENIQTEGQERGMVTDFGEVKKALKAQCDYFDHTFIYEEGSLKDVTVEALKEEGFALREVDFRPTAELFAKYFFEKFMEIGFYVYEVTVYETPNNCATFKL